MSNPATVTDVEDRMPRPLTTQEEVNAEVFLDDAWEMLLGRRPNLEVDLAAATVSERNVIRVLATMVVRVLKNPDGYDSESVDDWTGRRNALVASGVLHVTGDELADVTPGRATRRSVRLVNYGDA